MKFSDWITNKYVTWRGGAIGKDKSITDFARILGVSQQTMSLWMNGSVPKRQSTVTKLVNQYGAEVYDVLGLERPKTQEQIIFDSLPKKLRRKWQEALQEANQQFVESADSGIELTAEEASAILVGAMAKRGIFLSDTDN